MATGKIHHPTKGFTGAKESKIRRKIARRSRKRNRS